jgi:hypothetical protein
MSENNSVWRKLRLASVLELTTDWWNRLREAQGAHYFAANYYRSLHYTLGVFVIAFSTIGLSFSFSGSNSKALGILGVLAALGASVQTFMNPIGLSEEHRVAGGRFSALRRTVEQFRVAYSEQRLTDPEPQLEMIKDRWEQLLKEVPVLPRWIWLEGGRPADWDKDEHR